MVKTIWKLFAGMVPSTYLFQTAEIKWNSMEIPVKTNVKAMKSCGKIGWYDPPVSLKNNFFEILPGQRAAW